MDKQKLDDLPASSDKEFWAEADIHTNIVPEKVHFFEQAHEFKRISGREAQCIHCDWGFDLDPGDKIIDGHLYDKTGKKVL